MTNTFIILKDLFQTKSGKLVDAPDFRTNFSPFLIQRWVSMDSKDNAYLVNETTNKLWSGLEDDRELWYKLYMTLISKKVYKKIAYIKKAEKTVNEKRTKLVELLAKRNNISQREVEQNLDILNSMGIEGQYDKLVSSR